MCVGGDVDNENQHAKMFIGRCGSVEVSPRKWEMRLVEEKIGSVDGLPWGQIGQGCVVKRSMLPVDLYPVSGYIESPDALLQPPVIDELND